MVNRESLGEYARGAIWVLPAVSSLVAVAAGLTLSQVEVEPGSRWSALAFQGTADDARSLLITISSTVVTVMAVVLGLTVVALQLASTQFSPRLLRNFLRDRPTQIVLSVFMGTFVYSTAGLYRVGVSQGSRIEEYPRVAVTGAMVLLMACLAMVIYFADHLVHSIQIDAVTGRVQQIVLRAVDQLPPATEDLPPEPAPGYVTLLARRSGYIQVAHPERLQREAQRRGVVVLLTSRVGQHVVEGTALAVAWAPGEARPAVDTAALSKALDDSVQIGFERTLQQDIAFGMRQLVDMSCKALSPAINDPYTAIQVIDHLAVIFAAISSRPLGDHVARDPDGTVRVVVPGRRFAEYLPGMCGLLRRYGGAEPSVMIALLRLLENCALLTTGDAARSTAIGHQVDLLVDDATRRIAQPADLAQVLAAAEAVRRHLVTSR